MSNSKLAQQIADKVARVKEDGDRIGGLYDYALRGVQAGLDRKPEFAPQGVEDEYRDAAEHLIGELPVGLSLGILWHGTISRSQAVHILAYLSEQNRKDA